MVYGEDTKNGEKWDILDLIVVSIFILYIFSII